MAGHGNQIDILADGFFQDTGNNWAIVNQDLSGNPFLQQRVLLDG
ncbi:MAG: hypothetical protein R2867_44730 [Caldilineaceae bacterium]